MLLGALLALFSAFAHAGWTTAGAKISKAGLPSLWACNAVATALLLPLALVQIVLLPTTSAIQISLLLAPISTVLHTTYAAALQKAYSSIPVSQVYPLSRGIAPFLITLASIPILDQWLSLYQLIGILLMAIALIMLVHGSDAAHSDGAPIGLRREDARIACWGLGIAIATACYTVYDGWAVATMGVDPVTYYLAAGILQLVLITCLVQLRGVRAGIALTRARPTEIFTVSILIPASYLFGLFATQYAPVSLVATIRSSSLLWTAIAAAMILHERPDRRTVLATALAIAATVTLAL